MESQYTFVQHMAQLYELLQDAKSRSIFWSRLQCDVQPTVQAVMDLYADGFDLTMEQRQAQKKLPEVAAQLQRDGKRLILYGAGGCGQAIAELLERNGVPFDGFCDRQADNLRAIRGKPVFSPDYLFAHAADCYVIITVTIYFEEITEILERNHFPRSQILPYFGVGYFGESEQQYFEFPELYRPDKAFVDGGSYDAAVSVQFHQWCQGRYSQILAFEPDAQNEAACRTAMEEKGLQNFRIFQAGMGKVSGRARFVSCNNGVSHVQNQEQESSFFFCREAGENCDESIELLALDDIAQDIPIGFIKMDIEGSELDALQGAEKTLRRDKPLLAICVYHRKGDTLAIMDYPHTVVPEYRFWLRHYSAMQVETVLYAAVPASNG